MAYMWKESYRIGVDEIDEEHYRLFQMLENILETLDSDDNWFQKKIDLKKSVFFLKNFVVKTFEDEEAYQKKINFPGIEEHKKEHRNVMKTLFEYEKQLIQSDYDRKVVANFTGLIVSWFVYHVSGSDKKICKGETPKPAGGDSAATCFRNGIVDALEKMAGVDIAEIKDEPFSGVPQGVIYVTVGMLGDIPDSILFAFSKELALGMFASMTGMEYEDVDEMVCSAMAEVSNIVCGHAATELADLGFTTDITTPQVTMECPIEDEGPFEGVSIDSPLGALQFIIKKPE
ncbi:MAG: chemotaxis protein CheX [Clostridia bacterium]|nr:chemotaxis protein CheX [Clostridia bacterium]